MSEINTEQKVIKALEICTTQSVCTGCPYEDPGRFLCGMKQDALSVIKEQQEKIQKLGADNPLFYQENKQLKEALNETIS